MSGWLGFGKKDPLDKIDIPKDQLPPEVEKPTGSAKSVENIEKQRDAGNMMAMSANFGQMANSMKEFSHVVSELKQGGEWTEALTVMNGREKSLQEKYKLDVKERELQIQQIKAQAQREETTRQQEKMKQEHELAMKKAQYEDQLRSKRKEQDLQREISAQQRMEEAKRETIMFEQDQQMKNEEKKAMIHARAQAQVERENHDLRMEQTKALAKEKQKSEIEIGKVNSKLFWDNMQKFLRNEDGMMTNTACGVGGMAIGCMCVFMVMREGLRQVVARTTKPNLVQETSRLSWNNKAAILRRLPYFAKPVERPNYIFKKSVQEKVEDITVVTRNVQKNNFAYRNVLLYGPPGTGKTLYAKTLATNSNMHYAIMSGGDVAPLGGQATYELNKMFDWANAQKKGMVLFVDEAEAFLRRREETMSPELRSVINTFLARTGEPSKKIQIILATNQVNQLDSAVLDRMNELLEIPLPGLDERNQMIKQYLMAHVIEPTQKKDQRVTLDAEILPKFIEICDDLAVKTEGMSGRELEKMCGNIYSSAVAQEDAVISEESLVEKALEYKKQSDDKLSIRESRKD